MTKELSKLICEKCGIKKRKIENKSFNWCDKCKYSGTFCKRPPGTPCPPHYKYVYPEFGQPENFVKLFELPIQPLTTLGFLLGQIYKIGNRIDFLTVLNLFLNDVSYNSTENERETIKEAIREAEWNYE